MPTLADAIDLAINKYLWDGAEFTLLREEFSCFAITMALRHNLNAKNKARAFVRSLGCDPYGAAQFDEFQGVRKRQYARALWLTWAAMIAREEEETK